MNAWQVIHTKLLRRVQRRIDDAFVHNLDAAEQDYEHEGEDTQTIIAFADTARDVMMIMLAIVAPELRASKSFKRLVKKTVDEAFERMREEEPVASPPTGGALQ